MSEKLEVHEYVPAKDHPLHCAKCPYLRQNPIHRRAQNGTFIRGTAHPNKTG